MEQAVLNPMLKNAVKDYLSKFNLNLCLTCGTCTNGCPVTGGEGAEGLDARKVLRMLAYGMVDEVVQSTKEYKRYIRRLRICGNGSATFSPPSGWHGLFHS